MKVGQDIAPTMIRLWAASEEKLATMASEVAVSFEPDVATRLARCLPTLTSMWRAAPSASFPIGFPTYRFDTERMDWLPVELLDGEGSFFFGSYWPEYRVVAD